MYLHVTREDSRIYFPNNTSREFYIELPLTLDCENYQIALLETYYVPSRRKDPPYYLYCDIVEPSIIGGVLKPLLASFKLSGSITHPRYLDITQKFVKRIKFTVESESTDSVDFEFVLHLRKL